MTNLLKITDNSVETLPIFDNDGILVMDSRDMANELGIKHKNLIESINTHKKSIEASFGHLPFETDTVKNKAGAINEAKFYLLNEGQSTFIATLSRNTPKVVDFKSKLVLSFIKAKELTKKVIAELTDEQIIGKALMLVQKQNERLLIENSELKEQRALDMPKLENHNALLNTDSLFSMDEAGKSLGVSGRRLKALLKDEKFLTQSGNPYQRFIDGKYFALKPVEIFNGSIYMQPMVTGKGLDMLTSWYKTLNHPNLKKKGLV